MKIKNMTLAQMETEYQKLIKEEKRLNKQLRKIEKDMNAQLTLTEVKEKKVGERLDDLEEAIKESKPPTKKERKVIKKEITRLQAKLKGLGGKK